MEAKSKLRTIVLTDPFCTLSPEREAGCLVKALTQGGVWRVHIRKPGNPERTEQLLKLMPPLLRSRVSVHYYPELATKHHVCFHMPERMRRPPVEPSISHTVHKPVQLHEWQGYDLLSPVCASFSKPGYGPMFSAKAMRRKVRSNTIAMGGMDLASAVRTLPIGFSGVAMLGAVWKDAASPASFDRTLAMLRKTANLPGAFALQFITNGKTAEETIDQAMKALAGGVRWIQVRMKRARTGTVSLVLERLAPVCDALGAVLIVDDRVELAATMPGVDGVHLGPDDMARDEARALLGPHKIIGSTAHDMRQLLQYMEYSDYMGIGPWRETETKGDRCPFTLGKKTTHRLIDRLHYKLPAVAIGGLTEADAPEVFSTGAMGMAVCGAIARAADPEKAAAQTLAQIYAAKKAGN